MQTQTHFAGRLAGTTNYELCIHSVYHTQTGKPFYRKWREQKESNVQNVVFLGTPRRSRKREKVQTKKEETELNKMLNGMCPSGHSLKGQFHLAYHVTSFWRFVFALFLRPKNVCVPKLPDQSYQRCLSEVPIEGWKVKAIKSKLPSQSYLAKAVKLKPANSRSSSKQTIGRKQKESETKNLGQDLRSRFFWGILKNDNDEQKGRWRWSRRPSLFLFLSRLFPVIYLQLFELLAN